MSVSLLLRPNNMQEKSKKKSVFPFNHILQSRRLTLANSTARNHAENTSNSFILPIAKTQLI